MLEKLLDSVILTPVLSAPPKRERPAKSRER